VWEMMVAVCDVQNDLYGWTPNMHIGHGHHTRRKVDLWAGQYLDFDDTIINLREQMGEGDMATIYQIGSEYPAYEEISWLLFIEAGGTVDPNENSAQVQGSLPWKTNVRLVQEEDFDLIGQITGMTQATLDRAKRDGLYSFGKEVAALRERSYSN